MKNKKESKIVFIGYGVLGDFIVCLKSLELLREKFPEAHITYVGNKTFAQLGFNDYHINEIIETDDELKKYYSEKGYKSEKWETVLNKTNLLINHPMDPDGIFVCNLQNKGFNHLKTPEPNFQLTKETKILLHGEVQNEENSAYEQVAELLLNIGVSTDNWVPSLQLPKTLISKAKRVINKYKKEHNANILLAFHPGASSVHKLMPLDKWKEVIKKSLNSKLLILVFTGPAEEPLLSEVKKELNEFNCINLHNEELQYAAALLSQCDLFFGHDTGFAHIAAALGVKSFLIFGKQSLPQVWAPPTNKTITIASENIKNLEINPLIISIKTYTKLLEIKSKITDIHTHFGPYGGREFSVEEVLDKVKKIGLKRIGIMAAPFKGMDDEIPANHKVLELIKLAKKDVEIIPILIVSPGMVKTDPDFKNVEDIPYKIIKIHPYAYDWVKHKALLDQTLQFVQKKKFPVMIHTGYDESNPENHEWLYQKYSDVTFILAHAKPFDSAYKMMNKYKNVWIDISFLDLEQLFEVNNEIDHNRILFGTDFPINELFYEHTSQEYFNLRIQEIIKNFGKKTLLKWGNNIDSLLNIK